MRGFVRNLMATALSIASSTSLAEESPMTVQWLLDQCAVPQKQLLCMGYISGVASVMALNSTARASLNDRIKDFSLCSASQPTNSALMQAFINWAHRHPERSSIPSQAGVAIALSEVWPCKPV